MHLKSLQVQKRLQSQNELSERDQEKLKKNWNKAKRQKVSDDKEHIQIKHEVQTEQTVSTKTPTKQIEEETKQKVVGKPESHKHDSSKKQIFKLAKEELKEKGERDLYEKFLMPYDIKKVIENDLSGNYNILDNIGFPWPSSFDKVLQGMNEISIASVKKIQNSIQRIKATERKLKELERKASENLKKKSKWIQNFNLMASNNSAIQTPQF